MTWIWLILLLSCICLARCEDWEESNRLDLFESIGPTEYTSLRMAVHTRNMLVEAQSYLQFFIYDGGTWFSIQTISPSAVTETVTSLAINSNFAVVGFHDSDSVTPYFVRIYSLSGYTWSMDDVLIASGLDDIVFESFGLSTAINDFDQIVIGANTNITDCIVITYEQLQGAWELVYYKIIPDERDPQVHLTTSALMYGTDVSVIHFDHCFFSSQQCSWEDSDTFTSTTTPVNAPVVAQGDCDSKHLAMFDTIAVGSCDAGLKLAIWKFLEGGWVLDTVISSPLDPLTASGSFFVDLNANFIVLGSHEDLNVFIYDTTSLTLQTVLSIDTFNEANLVVGIDDKDIVHIADALTRTVYLYNQAPSLAPSEVPSAAPSEVPSQAPMQQWGVRANLPLFNGEGFQGNDELIFAVSPSSLYFVVAIDYIVEFWIKSNGYWTFAQDIVMQGNTVRSLAINDMYAVLGVLEDDIAEVAYVYEIDDNSQLPQWELQAMLNLTEFNGTTITSFATSVAINDQDVIAIGANSDSRGFALLYQWDQLEDAWAVNDFFFSGTETEPTVFLTDHTLVYITNDRNVHFVQCPVLADGCDTTTITTFHTDAQDLEGTSLNYCSPNYLAVSPSTAVASCSSGSTMAFWSYQSTTQAWRLDKVASSLTAPHAPGSYLPVGVYGSVAVAGSYDSHFVYILSTDSYTRTSIVDFTIYGADVRNGIMPVWMDSAHLAYVGFKSTAGVWRIYVLADVTPTDYPSQLPSETPSISMSPTEIPSMVPSEVPSQVPSMVPSQVPSEVPSAAPMHQWDVLDTLPLFEGFDFSQNGAEMLIAVSPSSTYLAVGISTDVEVWRKSGGNWFSMQINGLTGVRLKSLAINDKYMVWGVLDSEDETTGTVQVHQLFESEVSIWTLTATLSLSEFNGTSITTFAKSVAINDQDIIAVSATSASQGYALLYQWDQQEETWSVSNFYFSTGETSPTVFLSEHTLVYITNYRYIRFVQCPVPSAACLTTTITTFRTNAVDASGAMLNYCSPNYLAVSPTTAVASCSSGSTMAFWSYQSTTQAWRLDKVASSLTAPHAPGSYLPVGVYGSVAVAGSYDSYFVYTLNADSHTRTAIVDFSIYEPTMRDGVMPVWVDSAQLAYVGFKTTDGLWNVYVLADVSPTSSPTEAPSETPSMSMSPSETPSMVPSEVPSQVPSMVPSEAPSEVPSESPSESPSAPPPTFSPSQADADCTVQQYVIRDTGVSIFRHRCVPPGQRPIPS